MKETSPIRVMLVDDHTILRSGLASFFQLAPEFELVAELSNGKEAVEKAGALNPDVILMDLYMPVMDGFTATQLIHKEQPQIPILVLTSTVEDELIQKALQLGAVGYLLKNTDTDQLKEAILTVYRGESYLVAEAAQLVMRRVAERERTQLGQDLTRRERDVLRLVVKGFSNQQIADDLAVSLPTVKFHVGNILSKLHVRSRTEAVVTALEHNLHLAIGAVH